MTAGAMGVLIGGLGIHKFYLGAWGWGVLYFLFCWTLVPAILGLVEGTRYLFLSQEEFDQKVAQLSGPFGWLW